MDRIRAGDCFKYRLTIPVDNWPVVRLKIISDIRTAFKASNGYYEPFHNGEVLQLYYPLDRGNIENGNCQIIVDAGDQNMTICERFDVNSGDEPMKIFNGLIDKWRKAFNDPSLELVPLNIR